MKERSMTGRLTVVATTLFWSCVTASALAAPPATGQATPTQSVTFATPDDAVAALVDASRTDDTSKLLTILGPGSESLVSSGDPIADHEARERFVAAFQQKHALSTDTPDRRTLIVGENDFPVALPIVQSDNRWHFDSRLGAQEIVDRRIGRNEIAAIRVALAYHDAQLVYFDRAKQSGAGEYAQRLVSTQANHDGLYWPSSGSDDESPLAPLVQQAEDEGYPGELVSGKPIPYQGYYFRILKGQGWAAPAGKMDYVVNGHMTKGFGLIGWPARYESSGVMTFIVNANGVVFQKDLGPRTEAIATGIKRYDPDLSWARVDVVP
jgi:Protein of unknown function (DUF2950)